MSLPNKEVSNNQSLILGWASTITGNEVNSLYDFCPNCRSPQKLIVSDFTKSEDDSNNEKTIIRSYHCSKCRFFIKSENNSFEDNPNGIILKD